MDKIGRIRNKVVHAFLNNEISAAGCKIMFCLMFKLNKTDLDEFVLDIKIVEIRKMLNYSDSRLYSAFNQLEKLGFIARSKSHGDKRVNTFKLL